MKGGRGHAKDVKTAFGVEIVHNVTMLAQVQRVIQLQDIAMRVKEVIGDILVQVSAAMNAKCVRRLLVNVQLVLTRFGERNVI